MKDARVTGAAKAGGKAQEYEEVRTDSADDNAASPVARTRPIITIDEAPNDEDCETKNEAPHTVTNPNARNGFQHNRTEDTYQSKPRYAVMIRWNFGYFKTAVGLLRLLFMLGVTLSLVCLGNAGTNEEDVLHLEAATRIRLHVFGCILVLLVGVLICILEVTSVKDSIPFRWVYMDIFSTFILGTLCIITSTLLLHSLNADPEDMNGFNGDDDHASGSGSGNGLDEDDDDDDEDDNGMPFWSKGMLAVSAVFGYFGTLVSVFLIIFKCFANKDAKAYQRRQGDVQEEVMMVSATNS